MSNPASTASCPESADVIVVGAGVAGLTAARELDKRNVSCIVLEVARSCGRTHVEPAGRPRLAGPGRTMDRADAGSPASLARELGVATFPQHHEGTKLLSWGGKLVTFKGDFPWLSLATQLELGLLDCESNPVRENTSAPTPPGPPDERPNGTARRSNRGSGAICGRAVAALLRRGGAGRLHLGAARSFVPVFLELPQVGTWAGKLISIKGGAQESRLRRRAQRISIRMAEQLGDRLVLECPVRSVAQNGRRRDGRDRPRPLSRPPGDPCHPSASGQTHPLCVGVALPARAVDDSACRWARHQIRRDL